MSDGTPEFSSFLGADGLTEGHGIAVENNTVYITGQTNSASFPTTSGALTDGGSRWRKCLCYSPKSNNVTCRLLVLHIFGR